MIKSYPPTIIIRHRKENLKKCSLRGLERHEEFLFYQYPLKSLPFLENYIFLSLEAETVLSDVDCNRGLLILDATWRYAKIMEKSIPTLNVLAQRRLPNHFVTAYPRHQKGCHDPVRGLASIEAIVAAYAIMGRSFARLLDHYYWKDSFVEKNRSVLL